MNNGYQKSNGCEADKEGGKIFNTFFYPELQSKHVRPLATNYPIAAILRDICNIEQRQNQTIAVDLCNK